MSENLNQTISNETESALRSVLIPEVKIRKLVTPSVLIPEESIHKGKFFRERNKNGIPTPHFKI